MKTLKSLLFFILSPLALLAQTESDTVFQSVAQRLIDYRAAAPMEKVYIHQDRTVYSAGEILWFKAYQSSDPDFPVDSKVLYVDIIDGMNQQVADTQWKVEDNHTATGSIQLSDTLSPGVYQLRAYTQWMQNFGKEHFFTRDFRIASEFTDSLQVETDIYLSGKTITASLRFLEIPEGELGYRLRINGDQSERFPLDLDKGGEILLDIDIPEEITLAGQQFFILETPGGNREYPIATTPPIQFHIFPEGGHLVTGLRSKVAFKVNDRQGKGLNATGAVVDQDGNEVRRFETRHMGHGTFNFVPEPGKQYTAILDDELTKVDFPKAQPAGLVMAVSHINDHLRVTLFHNLKAEQTQTPFYLTVHQSGKTWVNAQIDMAQTRNVVDIPFDQLPSGIFTITVYDEKAFAYAERLAFVDFPEALAIKMKTDKTEYAPRQKVTVELEASNVGQFKGGDFSVAVVRSELDDLKSRDNLYTHFFLSSELKGEIENPASYFNPIDSLRIPNMDLLLMTQGWRCYAWEDIMARTYPEITFYPEPGLTFSGKAHFENEKQKAEDVTVTAVFRHIALNDVLSFQPAENGDFTLTNYDFQDTAEVIISAMHKKHAIDVSAKALSRALPDFYDYGTGISMEDEAMQSGSETEGIIIPSQPSQQKGDMDKIVHELGEVTVTARAKRLKTFNRHVVVLHEEAFNRHTYDVREDRSYAAELCFGALGILFNVGGVRVLGSCPGVPTIRVAGTLTREFKPGNQPEGMEPVFILDGKRTTKEDLMMLSPFLVERVEVLNATSAMMYASAPFGGAIVFHTRSGYKGVDTTPTKTLTYRFAGYNQAKAFYSPDYTPGTYDFAKPDHRNTLYWKPDVTIGEGGNIQFSFFTSDDKEEYLIHCEGRSADGILGASDFVIRTK